ncbi:MAG: hypothetical protein HY318_16040 [Armatimonadetes bacterium]|nr:hypothetical protein [Armatimonadota bacterium]
MRDYKRPGKPVNEYKPCSKDFNPSFPRGGRDTGEGIPEEYYDRIFEKFGQVETRKSGRKMSTGLGLTFCKMVAEAHGGATWVESELGKGSTFWVRVPLQPLGGETG